MSVLALANNKGGVGRTTTAVNLAAALTEQGKRILLLDLDPQASLTIALGLEPDSLQGTIRDILDAGNTKRRRPNLRDVIIKTPAGLDLVPANLALTAAEPDLLHAMGGEYALRKAITPINTGYDFIIIDCPPSLGMLTINALTAADHVLIPLQPEFLPMKGMQVLLSTISKVRSKLNPNLKISGVLLTMVESRTRHSREVSDVIRKVFKDKVRVFDTSIKRSVKLKYSVAAAESILTYAKDSEVANAYRQLAREVITDA